MKKTSILISLVILLLASLACNIGGAAPATPAAQEPTTVIEPTSPAATTAPAQQAVGIDGPPGPETIDLGTPALYILPSVAAFTLDFTVKETGVDTTGGAKEVLSMRQSAEVQTQPQIAQHFFVSWDGADGTGTADTVVLGDQFYTVQVFSGGPTGCKTLAASSMQGPSMLDSMFKLQQMITGQAQRVESGIAVNGFVTDKYELSKENLKGNDKSTGELISTFVYVARSAGFITLFESQSRQKTDTDGFDPNQFTNVTTTYNYIPVEDGSLDIAVPAECNK